MMVTSPSRCSLHAALEVVAGEAADYKPFAPYHYRDEQPRAVKAVFLLRPKRPLGSFGRRAAGAIVYCMPRARVEMRRIATGGLFADLDRQTELALLNRNVRCITRLVIEPPFRGIGLATRLVRETLGRLDVPLVEALGVMGAVHPFFERAGMQGFAPRASVAHVTLLEALSAVGIGAGTNDDSPLRIDPQALQQRMDALPSDEAAFLEGAIQGVLKSHGTRWTMPPGLERTRYLLTRLTQRPMYYLWRNGDLEVTWP